MVPNRKRASDLFSPLCSWKVLRRLSARTDIVVVLKACDGARRTEVLGALALGTDLALHRRAAQTPCTDPRAGQRALRAVSFPACLLSVACAGVRLQVAELLSLLAKSSGVSWNRWQEKASSG